MNLYESIFGEPVQSCSIHISKIGSSIGLFNQHLSTWHTFGIVPYTRTVPLSLMVVYM